MTGFKASGSRIGIETAAKWILGGGIGCLVVVMAVLVIGLVSVGKMKRKMDAARTELQANGFNDIVRGETIERTERVNLPMLFIGQTVRLRAECRANVAAIAERCEVYGHVQGKLFFRGQVLCIQPGAVIDRGLNVRAKEVHVLGTVKGGITGEYQTLEQGTPGAS